jgi:NADPH-dependent ferric siderophore reductase
MLSTLRVRHELKFRPLEVLDIRDLTPGMRSITFASDELRDFPSASFDDHLKLMVPSSPGAPLEAPVMTPGGPQFQGPPPLLRDFTPRSFDNAARRLTIEFALHSGGAASDWARAARKGDHIAIGGPRGSTVIPLGYDWHVLAGDESALPAIARRLEELPAGARVDVFLETKSEADRRSLASKAKAKVVWLSASGDALAAAIRHFEKPAGEGFVWAAGEAASMRSVRAALREVHGMTSSHSRVSAYWKRGAIAHHEDLD